MKKEPSGWLYQFIRGCIQKSVEKYPTEKMKWLGNPGVNRMKLWAMVLAKQGVLKGDLKQIEVSAEVVSFDTPRLFNNILADAVYPWDVDREARNVLEFHPEWDGNPDRRNRERNYQIIEPSNTILKPQYKLIKRPGQQDTMVMIQPREPMYETFNL